MASQKAWAWLGLIGLALIVAGVGWLLLESLGEDAAGPEVGPAARGPATPARRAEAPAGGPRSEPAAGPGPRPSPPRTPPARRAAPTPASPVSASPAPDYGPLDAYRLSTLTPTVFGTVQDERRRPLPGAEVTLLLQYPPPFDYKRVTAVRTDRAGRFVLPATAFQAGKRYHLRVAAAGWTSAFFWNVPPGKRLDVRLEKGPPLMGRVLDAKGRPLAGARVLARSPTWREVVRTDRKGRFRFAAVPRRGVLTLQASARDHVPREVQAAGRDQPVEIRLGRGVPVRGRIVDGLTKEPLTGATVSLGVPGLPDRREVARSDAEGRYAIGGLAPGFHTLFVVAPGYSERMHPLKVEKRRRELVLDFALYPVGLVRGQVQDESGRGVADAAIYVARKNVFVYYVPQPPREAARTDANGFFEIPALDANPDFDCKLAAVHPDYLRGESGVVKPKPGGVVEGIVIRLRRGVVFSGRVLDPRGAPVPAASVQVTPMGGLPLGTIYWGSGIAGAETARTDAQGRFRLHKLTAGRVRVKVSADGFRDVQEILEIPAGGLEKDFRLEVGFSIAGRVTDTEGRGIPNARVHAAAPHPVNSFGSALTNAEGYYKIRNLKQGVFTLTARAPGYAEGRLEGIAAGEKKANFHLRKNGAITGRVVRAADGAPVKRFHVNLQVRLPDGTFRWYREIPQAPLDGRYRITDLEPGEYIVTIRTEEYAESRRTGVLVASGAETKGVDFVLRAGAAVEGRVTDVRGNPVKGSHVVAQPLTKAGKPDYQAQSRSAPVKADGTFRLRGLRAGPYHVRAMAGGFCQGGGQVVQVMGEGVVRVNLILQRGGNLQVKVTDRRGRPVAGARVSVVDGAGNQWGARPGEPGVDPGAVAPLGESAGDAAALGVQGPEAHRTNAAGEFRLPVPICPGPAVVTVSAPGYRTAKVQVHIVDEQTVPCRVVLRK